MYRARRPLRNICRHVDEKFAKVGTTGGTAGKPPHLHHSILSAVPCVWEITREPQGWKTMIYLNMDEALRR